MYKPVCNTISAAPQTYKYWCNTIEKQNVQIENRFIINKFINGCIGRGPVTVRSENIRKFVFSPGLPGLRSFT